MKVDEKSGTAGERIVKGVGGGCVEKGKKNLFNLGDVTLFIFISKHFSGVSGPT